MEFRAGILLGVVPGFRETLLRPEAVKLAVAASGSECDNGQKGERRPLSKAEEDLLFNGAGLAGVSMGLLELPEHLIKRWRRLEPHLSEGTEPAPAMDEKGYRDFVQSVLEFLRFKQVCLPEQCRCDAIMIPSRGSPLALNRRSNPVGTVYPDRAQDDCIAINVGEESATVVFCNLARHEMAEALSGCANDESLAGIFLQWDPAYGLVCIELEPRQGVLITGVDQICADYFAGASLPGAVLLIRGA